MVEKTPFGELEVPEWLRKAESAARNAGKAEGKAEGNVEGRAEALLTVLAARGITVSRERPALLPPIAADAEQLRQVLTHLVVNAEEAMAGRAGPRRLAVATRAVPGGPSGGDMVELSVADGSVSFVQGFGRAYRVSGADLDEVTHVTGR